MRSVGVSLLCLVSVALTGTAPKKPAKAPPPEVRLVMPFGMVPGQTARLTVRGQHLDTVTAVQFKNVKASVKILRKGKAAVPNKIPPAQVGDTEVEIEVRLPSGVKTDKVLFRVVSPAGESKPHELLVDHPGGVMLEKEPNDSFSQAQAVIVPSIVQGVIAHPQDVDVYRLEGQAGEKLMIEVQAARYGSALDSLLTIYDSTGRELASNDDSGNSRDSRLAMVLPHRGSYYVVVMDANDEGSPLHIYRLHIRTER